MRHFSTHNTVVHSAHSTTVNSVKTCQCQSRATVTPCWPSTPSWGGLRLWRSSRCRRWRGPGRCRPSWSARRRKCRQLGETVREVAETGLRLGWTCCVDWSKTTVIAGSVSVSVCQCVTWVTIQGGVGVLGRRVRPVDPVHPYTP